jgi:soluble lytic murein transglycosylase
VEPPRLRPGTAALEGQALERPRILLEAGLVSEARDELDRLFARARGLDDRLALAELYSNAGDFHRPQRLVVDAYVEELGRGPAPAQLELWWHAWPAPFAGELERALVGLDGLEPELVYSIMREESGYRPEVVSISGARGLLQLMPSTAERLATQVRLDPFSADDLFDPGVNIRLGATYLQQLLDRFDGRRSAAIGSYNAGPDPVARWLAAADTEDDEWVESIGYDQTRTYVKRVLRSLHVYRVLY